MQTAELLKHLNTWAPAIVLALVGVSYLLHLMKKLPHPMTWRESLANIAVFLIWKFLFFSAGAALHLWIFTWLYQWRLFTIPQGLGTFLVALLVIDFLYYWKHRAEHRINLLWAQHHVHHSSVEYNFSTSLRLPWLGSYVAWIFFVPAVLLGFHPLVVVGAYQVLLAYQYLVHTEMVQKVGFLEVFMNTPSHHRVHHGRNPLYLDKNYGGILIVWDKLFGTFEKESEPVDYGTVHLIETQNPFLINVKPWIELWRDLEKLPSWSARFRGLLKPPGEI